MVCKFCGEAFDDILNDCPNCGISINETEILKESVFFCPVCGAENPPGERKCHFCCSLFPKE